MFREEQDSTSDLPDNSCMNDPDPAEPTIRRGSPFRDASVPPSRPTDSVSADGAIDRRLLSDAASLDPDWGVLRAAIWASAWSLMFVIACWAVFPGGGVLVAALGCALAVVGMFSSRPIPAIALLAIHAGMFFACYSRMLGS